jgi:hypothetical protein
LERGLYDFVNRFLGFWVFDYCGVNIRFLYGVGFSEGGRFPAFFPYDYGYLWLLQGFGGFLLLLLDR